MKHTGRILIPEKHAIILTTGHPPKLATDDIWLPTLGIYDPYSKKIGLTLCACLSGTFLEKQNFLIQAVMGWTG